MTIRKAGWANPVAETTIREERIRYQAQAVAAIRERKHREKMSYITAEQ
jgi:hypothetical protein